MHNTMAEKFKQYFKDKIFLKISPTKNFFAVDVSFSFDSLLLKRII